MRVGWDFLRDGELPPVVIVGSGPAGVTLALSLADRGIPSLCVEAGGEDFSPQSQDVYIGTVLGDPYFDLDVTRLRQFGGSSNHWMGICRPLDAHDFEARPDIPHTGWPIGRQDLDPYLARASQILEIDAVEDFALDGNLIEAGFAFSAPPVRFAEKYAAFFDRSRLAHLALETPVLSLAARSGRIVGVELGLPDGTQLTISPGIVVVCTGGLENSRLLLWSNEVSPEPVVPHGAALGRFWMEHLHYYIGDVEITRTFARRPDEYGNFSVAPSIEAMRRYGIMGGALRLQPVYHGQSLLRDALKRGLCSVRGLSEPALDVLGEPIDCTREIFSAWEQAPDPENRIILSRQEARDVHGVPRIELHWRKRPLDYRTPKVILELFGRYLLRERFGHVRVRPHVIDQRDYPSDDQIGGHHHMGGTRMGESAASAVVDRDLRIFDVENFYVLGSSVFPTGGYANPTLTITQLALRLADHLAARF